MQKLEVVRKEGIRDPFSESVKNRVLKDLGIKLESVKAKQVFLFDTKLTEQELKQARGKIFNDPQVEEASFEEIIIPYDYRIDIAWKPGTKDTKGEVSVEALEDLLKRKLSDDEKVYTSMQLYIKGDISQEQAIEIGKQFANETVQQINTWKEEDKPEVFVPKVDFDLKPKIFYSNLNVSDDELVEISRKESLSLNLAEMKEIQDYFNNPKVIAAREKIGMKPMPTLTELNIIAQTWSEHCKHKIFNALMKDVKGNILEGIPDYDGSLDEILTAGGTKQNNTIIIDSIFSTYIKKPAKELQGKFSWIKSILKDNAGVVVFNDDWLYTLKWESHNSPSKVEPFGGSYTGIVGVYRDPMCTGLGGKIIAGFWSFHTGSPFYKGDLNPALHPRQILEGVRQGVEAGGNRSGNPTTYGFIYLDEGFIGKPYIGVGAMSLIPMEVHGKPGWEKSIKPDDLAIVIGGKVGIDGIHGATESSLEGGKHISPGHVQIGDAYTQKKVQDFVIEARDKGYILAIQDLGAAGVSSAFGELAEFTNGINLDLKLHPTKYAGLMPWQIAVSESQERVAFTANPKQLNNLIKLAEKHDIDLTVLGTFNDSGDLLFKHGDLNCAYLDMKFLHSGGPRFEMESEWLTPEERGLEEPLMPEIKDHGRLLKELLSNENIASYNYIVRQFDHEVQGGSTVKPLVGVKEDVHTDASVIRPVLDSHKGIANSCGNNPEYGEIDTYHMTMNNFDEAIRRVIAVGGDLEQVPMNDNFGWPSPKPGPSNPLANYRTAQLIRAAKAVADGMRAYKAPCISGKDSMSLDGTIPTKDGGEKRVSAPPIVQMSTAALINDTRYCITLDAKKSGDLVYVLGLTKDELGGSALYKHFGEVGRNVPIVDTEANVSLYNAHSKAVKELTLRSSHGIYRGGLGVHLAMVAMGSDLGMKIRLSDLPMQNIDSNDKALYSQSAGRFIVTVRPKDKEKFEGLMQGNVYACIGEVMSDKQLMVYGLDNELIINENIHSLRNAYHSTFDGELNERN